MVGCWFGMACCGAVLSGCGAAGPVCLGGTVTTISPVAAVADHAAPAPGDMQKFSAVAAPKAEPGCPQPQIVQLLTPVWSVSDPVNVAISSAQDSTNGVATCLGATAGTVQVTAVSAAGGATLLATASLTCR